MIELYLAGYKADITADLEIPMTYENISLGSPEAVKNNYSKTIRLQGTKTNNKIFGQIYRLDRSIIDGSNNIGIYFDANKRVEYFLKYDGSLYDRGYFKLDSIDNDRHVVQYNLTLYGGLGNFFYSLMYSDTDDQEGIERNLGSLYYGIDDRTKEAETRVPLLEYNADFVKKSWTQRCSDFNMQDVPYWERTNYTMFCPIHTYGGYYENFDSNKVLINTDVYGQNGVPFELTKTEGEDTYSTKKGWALVETPRDMCEDEIQDIRSHYQRLGIRLKNIYDAIKNPENNGGYEVDDSAIDDVQRAYIDNGYLMLKQFDWEEINSDFINTTIKPTWDLSPMEVSTGYNQSTSSNFDVSEYLNPNAQICLLPELKIYYGTDTDLRDNYTTQGPGYGGSYSYSHSKNRVLRKREDTVKSWLTYYFVKGYTNNDTEQFVTPIYMYGGTYGRGRSGASTKLQNKVEQYILDKFNLKRGTPGSSYNTTEFNYTIGQANEDDEGFALGSNLWKREEKQDEDGFTKWLGNYIKIQVPITKETTKLRVYTGIIQYSSYYLQEWNDKKQKTYDDFGPGYPMISDSIINIWFDKENKNGILSPNATSVSITNTYISDSDGFNTQIYDGDVSLESDRHVLNKNAIFHGTPTPYDFLINLSRMFNWKFLADNNGKKVYIYSSKNFYQNIVTNIEDKLDFTKYTIKPTTAEHKYYSFVLDQDDTYAKKLWESKYGNTYGMNVHKTRYEFAKDTHNILENCEFKQAIPWRLSSVYFNRDIDGWPTPTLGNKYTVSLFKGSDSKEFQYTGYLSTTLIDGKKNISQNTYDAYPKLCCFDSDFSPVDNDNCLVFYDRLTFDSYDYKQVTNVQVSNNIEICKELNDNNCYYLCKGQDVYSSKYNTKKSTVAYIAGNQVPCFSNRFYYDGNIYFYSYKDEKNDITMNMKNLYGISKTYNLYDLYFKSEYSDMYAKDAKIIKIKYKLNEDPKEAMRKFYKFSNGIWILNKVTNWSPKHNNYTECEFLKINDINNYIQ